RDRRDRHHGAPRERGDGQQRHAREQQDQSQDEPDEHRLAGADGGQGDQRNGQRRWVEVQARVLCRVVRFGEPGRVQGAAAGKASGGEVVRLVVVAEARAADERRRNEEEDADPGRGEDERRQAGQGAPGVRHGGRSYVNQVGGRSGAIRLLIGLAISLVFIVATVSRVDLAQVADALRRVDFRVFLIAVPLIFL